MPTSKSKSNAETQRESRVSWGSDSRAADRCLQTNNTEGRIHGVECVTRSVWQNMAVFEGLVGCLPGGVGNSPEAAVACERSRAHSRHGPGSPGSPDGDAQSQASSSSAADSFFHHSACLPCLLITAEDIDVKNFEDFLVLFSIHAINLLAIFFSIFIPDLHSLFFPFFFFSLPDVANTLTELPRRETAAASCSTCLRQSADWPSEERLKPGPAPIPGSISGIRYLLL